MIILDNCPTWALKFVGYNGALFFEGLWLLAELDFSCFKFSSLLLRFYWNVLEISGSELVYISFKSISRLAR